MADLSGGDIGGDLGSGEVSSGGEVGASGEGTDDLDGSLSFDSVEGFGEVLENGGASNLEGKGSEGLSEDWDSVEAFICEDVQGMIQEETKEETQEEIVEGTQEETQEGTQEETQEGTQEETEEGTQEETQEGTQEETEEGIQEETQEGTQEETEEGAQEETEEGAQEETEEGAQEETEEGIQEETEEETQEETEEGAQEETEEGAQEETEEGIQEETEEGIQEETEEGIQEETEEETQEETEEETEEEAKEGIQEKAQEQTQEGIRSETKEASGRGPGGGSGEDHSRGELGSTGKALREIPRAEQYARQKQQSQEELELAIQQAFGKEVSRQMEIQRMVEQINELTAPRYELSQEISKRDPVLDKYTDHGPEHIKEVATNVLEYAEAFRQFAQSRGIELGSEADINLEVLLVAALYHDTGMDGGLKSVEDYSRQCAAYEAKQELTLGGAKIKEFGEVIRSNHPAQSALHVLEDAGVLQQQGVNPNEVAALAYLHSKSNSGVKVGDTAETYSRYMTDFMQRCQATGISVNPQAFARQVTDAQGRPVLDLKQRPTWEVTDKEAFVRKEFEVAVQCLTKMAQDKGLNFDPSFLGKLDEKGNFIITNSQAYTRLQYETAILRLADAQRPARHFPTTHSGKVIELNEPDWAEREQKIAGNKRFDVIKSELSAVDVHFTKPASGAVADRVESRLFTNPEQNRISWNISKQFYIGESNVDRGQVRYDSETRQLEIEYRVKDACKAPHTTVEILRERMAECRMPELAGGIQQIVVLERASKRSFSNYRRGIGAEKGCRITL